MKKLMRIQSRNKKCTMQNGMCRSTTPLTHGFKFKVASKFEKIK